MADQAIFDDQGKRNLLKEIMDDFGIGRGASNNGYGGSFGSAGTTGAGAGAGAAAAGAILGLEEILNKKGTIEKQNANLPKEDTENNNLNAGNKIIPSLPLPENNTIEDTTEENIETKIDNTDWKKWFLDRRAEEWERQDTAYSRAIADLRKSGVNVNLLGNIQPAQSSAGDSSVLTNDLNNKFDLLMQEIELNYKSDSKTKERFYDLLKEAMGMLLIYGATNK